MAIQYTIREVTTSSITVDYADGTWSTIPINSLMTRKDIEESIGNFQPATSGFNSIDEVPFKVGESGETLTYFDKLLKKKQEEIQREEEEKNRLYTYSEIRKGKYPDLGDQLDALYWARHGDSTIIQQIDEEIENIKLQYPKNMDPMTLDDLTQSGVIP